MIKRPESSTSYTGEIDLTLRRHSDGRTYLSRQYFKLPLQIMKPHYYDQDGTAFIYLMNPGGGVLQGDRYRTAIHSEAGTDGVISTPSSTKLYKMEDDHAEMKTELRVDKGAALEYLPEHNVPFAGSDVWQDTEIHLEQGSVLFASDMVTAGRTGRDEYFAYDHYASRTKIYVEGRLQVYDSTEIRPEETPVARMGLLEGRASNGALYIYGEQAGPALVDRINQFGREVPATEGIEPPILAATQVAEGLIVVRLVGDRVSDLREALLQVWDLARRELLGKPAVRIRKY